MHKVSMSLRRPKKKEDWRLKEVPLLAGMGRKCVLSYRGATEAVLGQVRSQDRRLMR